MPLDSCHSRIIKHSKRQQTVLLNAVIPVVAQYTMSTVLSFLFNRPPPKPMRTSSLSGGHYIYEVLNCGNPRRIQEVLRMKLEVFQFLCVELQNKGLSPSKYISIEEQVAMFLFTVARTVSNRDVQERFQHSGETVSRYFHVVLQAINQLVPKFIKLPNANEIPTVITSNSKFYNFFNNCIGALDGTHIEAKVPEADASAFRNRKGALS